MNANSSLDRSHVPGRRGALADRFSARDGYIWNGEAAPGVIKLRGSRHALGTVASQNSLTRETLHITTVLETLPPRVRVARRQLRIGLSEAKAPGSDS